MSDLLNRTVRSGFRPKENQSRPGGRLNSFHARMTPVRTRSWDYSS